MSGKKEINYGLTAVRTGRLVAAVIAFAGMLMLFIQRVLAAILVMANDAVTLGLARYNNFTGRFASNNFAEDKQLLGLLKEVQDILPAADTALAILLALSIALLAIALIGLALPRQFVHILVALKLLKWKNGEGDDEGEKVNPRQVLETIGNVPLKKLAFPVAIIITLIILCLGISTCHQRVISNSVEGNLEDMQLKALAYIDAQKAYFGKNKTIGGPAALKMTDSLSTDAFDMKVTATRFSAVSKIPLGECPAGSRWQVAASTKGVFNVELSLYRGVPKDTNCVKLTPDFKNLGRKSR